MTGEEAEKREGRGRGERKEAMVLCSQTHTCQVFSGCWRVHFWGGNKCKRTEWEVEEEGGGGGAAKIFKSCLGFK